MLKKVVFYIVLIALLANFSSTKAQRTRMPNNPNYDLKPYHFGFLLGLNNMDFTLKNVQELNTNIDTLYGIEPSPKLGFNVGILANLRLGEYFDLRFTPSLSFGERNINYFIKFNNTVFSEVNKKIESTYLEFPLELKYKSKRLVNSRAYLIGGAKYILDLASQAKKKEENDEIIVKLRRDDIMLSLGVGFDFYLTYFKFATELKMSWGMKNLLIYENNVYTDGIERLRNKMLQISFTFE
jgi:hypothetical protein